MKEFIIQDLTPEFLTALLDSVPIPVYFKDKDFRYLGANKAFEEFFGQAREYILGKTVFDIVPREQAEIIYLKDVELMKNGGTQVYEAPLNDFFGALHYVIYHKKVFADSQGNVAGIIGTILDVTDQKKAEDKLKESERRFRSLYENAVLGIFRSTPGGKFLMANPAFIEMLGYESFSEIAGLNIEKDIYKQPSTRISFRDSIEKNGEVIGFEAEWQSKEGTTCFIRESARVVKDAKGKIIYYEGTAEDITERKKVEDNLRALTLRQEALLSAVPEIIMEVDNNKVYTWANKHGLEFFGEDVIGKEAAEYFEGEQRVYETVQPLFDGSEKFIRVESWQRRRDGQKRLLSWSCTTLRDENGNVTGALSSARDITNLWSGLEL
jgi:PAS domain S-box-containing protein